MMLWSGRKGTTEYGNSNKFLSLFLWKNREKASRKGQHDLVQGLRLAWGRHHFLWFTFSRCSAPCTSSTGNGALLVSIKSFSTRWSVLFCNFHFFPLFPLPHLVCNCRFPPPQPFSQPSCWWFGLKWLWVSSNDRPAPLRSAACRQGKKEPFAIPAPPVYNALSSES